MASCSNGQDASTPPARGRLIRARRLWARPVVVLIVWLLTATSAMAQVVYRETITEFDLGPGLRSRADIVDAFQKRGPYAANLKGPSWGATSWVIKPLWWWRNNAAGRCTVTRVRVTVSVSMKLPTWSDAAAAPVPVARYFACVADVVRRHEAGHAAIARRTAEALHTDLMRGLKDVSCGALQTKGTLIHRRRLALGDERQTAFDTSEYARPRYKKCRSYLK